MDYLELRTAFTETLRELVHRASDFVPNLISFVVLVLLGWLVAKLARASMEKLLGAGLRRLAKAPPLESAVQKVRAHRTIPLLASGIVYWIILLFFIAAAVERLELDIASDLVGRLAVYLPNVLLGLLLVFAGIIAGSMAHSTIARAGASAGMAQAPVLGRAAEILIVFIGVVIGIDQVGIQSTLLMLVVTVFVATVLGGVALAFGLGSGTAVSNLISARYLAKTYRVGQTVFIEGIEGRILEITQTGVILEAPRGRVLVPARKFSEEASILVAGER